MINILVNQVCMGNRKEGKKNQNSQYNNYDNIYCNMWIFAGFLYICNVNNLCDLLSSIKAVIISVFYSAFYIWRSYVRDRDIYGYSKWNPRSHGECSTRPGNCQCYHRMTEGASLTLGMSSKLDTEWKSSTPEIWTFLLLHDWTSSSLIIVNLGTIAFEQIHSSHQVRHWLC